MAGRRAGHPRRAASRLAQSHSHRPAQAVLDRVEPAVMICRMRFPMVPRPRHHQILDHAAEIAGEPHHHVERSGPRARLDLGEVGAADPGMGRKLPLIEPAVFAPSPYRVNTIDRCSNPLRDSLAGRVDAHGDGA
jgi:hypothetical protein